MYDAWEQLEGSTITIILFILYNNYALYHIKLYIMSMAGTWVVFKIRSIE
jgi:hypothetical protein